MEFKQAVITKQGRELMAKLLAGGTTTQFTKIVVSSTVYSDAQLENLTSLTNVKMSAVAQAYGNNTATVAVTAAIENTGLTAGFYVNTVGLYATDPIKGEILYSVSSAKENGYMPADTGVSKSGFNFKIYVEIGNASQVNLEVDPAAYATQGDLNRWYTDIEPYIESVKTKFRNLFDEKNVRAMGIRTAPNNLTEFSSEYRGWFMRVKPKEVYSLQRFEPYNNSRFSYVFTQDYPQEGTPWFGGNFPSINNKVENIVVPDGANYLFIYLANDASPMAKIKVEKNKVCTAWVPFLDDDVISQKDLLNFFANKNINANFLADFDRKISGSIVENPHTFLSQSGVSLRPVESFTYEMSQEATNQIKSLDSQVTTNGRTEEGVIYQQCFKWNIVEDLNRKIPGIYEALGALTLNEKVNVARSMIRKVKFSVWGFGIGPNGYKLYFSPYSTQSGWATNPRSHSESKVGELNWTLVDLNRIDSNGYAYAIVYTDPSDGVTQSQIRIDYASLLYTVDLNVKDMFISKAKYQQEIGAIKTWIQQQGGTI